MFTDLRDELYDNDPEYNTTDVKKKLKCPELKFKLNDIEVTALVDSGSQVEVVSQEWYDNNKERLGKVEVLPMANTIISTALGIKSKVIRKQIMLRVNIENFTDDVVFLVIPGLSRSCIIGINVLKLYNCILDFKNYKLILNMYNPEEDIGKQQVVDILELDIQKNATSETSNEWLKTSLPSSASRNNN